MLCLGFPATCSSAHGSSIACGRPESNPGRHLLAWPRRLDLRTTAGGARESPVCIDPRFRNDARSRRGSSRRFYEAIFEAELELLESRTAATWPAEHTYWFSQWFLRCALYPPDPGPGGRRITATSSMKAFNGDSANGSGGAWRIPPEHALSQRLHRRPWIFRRQQTHAPDPGFPAQP